MKTNEVAKIIYNFFQNLKITWNKSKITNLNVVKNHDTPCAMRSQSKGITNTTRVRTLISPLSKKDCTSHPYRYYFLTVWYWQRLVRRWTNLSTSKRLRIRSLCFPRINTRLFSQISPMKNPTSNQKSMSITLI